MVHLEEHVLETFILALMENGRESHGKTLISWKTLIKNINAQIMLMLINMAWKCGTLLKFLKDNGCIKILKGKRSLDDERQINRWKRIVIRFKGKLVKMIKDAVINLDGYSISPKIREMLLHWGYESKEKDFFINSTN